MAAIDCYSRLALCYWLEVCTFRQTVAQQADAVFIQASLTRTVSVCKKDLCQQRCADCLMIRERFSIVSGNRVDKVFKGP
jgi:hypothetical protein